MKQEEKNTVETLPLVAAVERVKENASKKPRKFIETVDLAANLNVDAKQSNQNVRGAVELPAGSGKTVRVVVFTDNEDTQKQALAAGAIKAGLNDLISEIENGFLGFDYCIATPDVMKNLGKIAKKLGPRGLMPNPKNGNITTDVLGVIKQVLKGKVNFKNDRYGIVHMRVGKINFSSEDLILNIKAVVNAIKDAKPEGLKGKYIKSIYLSTTMGPSVAVDIDNL